jgi:hypothetical protein
MRGSLCVGLGLVAACAGDARPDNPFESGSGVSDTEVATSSVGTQAGTSQGEVGESADPSDDEGVLLDVGAPSTEGADEGNGDAGCHKVDFLFVIDNSGSMSDEQDNLINSFGGFIETIRDTVQAQDYQIMVVDTDASGGGSSSITCTNGDCSCTPVPACCETLCNGFGDSCNGVPCDMLPGGECDGTLGAGKIFRNDGTQCLDEPGPRFMTQDDADLGEKFACVGEVGTFGDGNEQPMASMLAAVGPELGAMGACNEGFVRDDAILVVTFITDEEDIEKSPGDPPDWKAGVIAAKNGNADAVVVLGLFGDTDQPGAICGPFMDESGAEPGVRLRAFTESFGNRGVVGSVCAADYAPFFQEAVAVIDLACDEFVPEG